MAYSAGYLSGWGEARKLYQMEYYVPPLPPQGSDTEFTLGWKDARNSYQHKYFVSPVPPPEIGEARAEAVQQSLKA